LFTSALVELQDEFMKAQRDTPASDLTGVY